ncbi:hypothetical protein AB0L05_20950 [Nonomuraea pusilla]|uniref:hypothetical protein n=1 Tax=Nonomuraea pusilla TaxID=46177 RepID=UPI00332CF9F4
MSHDAGNGVIDRVDALMDGYISPERAQEISRRYPAVSNAVVGWIRESAAQRNWRRVERFANLAAALKAAGLGGAVIELVDSAVEGLNYEDLVDILGEIGEEASANSMFRLAERSREHDAPAFWLCQKVILSLSELDTDEARDKLRMMTTAAWPSAVRWHAAVALGVEEQLGFDEDHLLGHS